MIKRSFRFLLLALWVTSASAFANSLSNLSIGGVKTGMTEQQAITALANNLGISKSKLEFRDRETIGFIDYKTGDETYALTFIKNYLNADGSKFVVSSIMYSNQKSIETAVVAKYGEPNSKSVGIYYWCDDKACSRPQEGYPDMELNLRFNALTLSTSQFSIARSQYMLKNRNEAKGTTF